MSEEKRKRLNSIGFTWKIREAHIRVDWEVRFQELVEYKRVYGNCNVPQRYKANTQLGRWVYTQRRTKETMSEEKRNQLNLIGFVWRIDHAIIDWEARFQELVEYKRVHGNCNVPQDYNENLQLGKWVMTQRTKKETMSEERRNKLNSIGFTWKVRATPIPVDWEVRFQELVEYKRVHGHCNVPYVQSKSSTRELGPHATTQEGDNE